MTMGQVDVTSLQGEELGYVNMNKIKPYQEPKTSQAYALQIMASHILESELRAKRSQLPEKNVTSSTTISKSRNEVISPAKISYYPYQKTLDEEDLDIHRMMLEGYYVQPSSLRSQCSQRGHHEKVKAYLFPTNVKGNREEHFLK